MPQGTSGQLLQSNGSSAPSWATAGDIGVGTADNLAGGTAGDIPYQNGPGSTTFLADPGTGGDGYVLTWNNSSTAPQWSDLETLAGAGYTLTAIDSGDNVALRLSDGSTNDDVLITAGSNITIDPVAAGGFTISAVAGGGGGGGLLSDVEVVQYTDEGNPRTEYACSNPISVTTSAGISTIGIGSTSNAYGKRYVQETEPTVDVCDGDIWYDTSTTAGASSAVLTGTIHMWGGSIASIPSGYQLCDGSAASTTALQLVVGSNVPDLRNQFIVGAHSDGGAAQTFNVDTGAISGNHRPGDTGGAVAHQLTIAEMPSHTHNVNNQTANISQWIAFSRNDIDPNTVNDGTGYVSGTGSQPGNDRIFTIVSNGGDDYHENRPPYYALVYMIKT